MPCYSPLQANFSLRDDGKKDITFVNSDSFVKGVDRVGDNQLMLPCGRCIGCRLERSRQWSVRIMHESQLYDSNCFITLTFDDDHLKSECVNGSISRKHMQDFFKRFRQEVAPVRIRYFCCGEYGDQLSRPHYHACVFNYDFSADRVFYKLEGDHLYYTSSQLSKVWTFGHAIITDLSFDAAAYVARYCTKKITGGLADVHYQGKTPEFCQMSRRPGIGYDWLLKYGRSDVFNHDAVAVRGVLCKPPRYYDKFLADVDPQLFDRNRSRREVRALSKVEDSTYRRLADRQHCKQAALKSLRRSYESSCLL